MASDLDSSEFSQPADEKDRPLAALSSDPEPAPAKQSRIISRVLSPAIQLWLRSQVERVENLQVNIISGDRQILSGYVPKVAIAAQNAIYQGLHLTQVQLTGENIRINLGQILRGQPLRLLAPVPMTGELILQEADLNASLQAPLLANAVTEFLVQLLRSQDGLEASGEGDLQLQDPQITIQPGQLILNTHLVSASGTLTPLIISTGLHLASGHELRLDKPRWLAHAQAQRGLPLTDLDGFTIDLGPEVNIQELTLADHQLICRGSVKIIPAE